VVSCCYEEFLLHYRDQLLGLLMLQKWPNLPGALVRGPLREKLKEISWWEQIIQPSGRTNGNCGSGSGDGGWGPSFRGGQGLSWAQLRVQLWPVVGALLFQSIQQGWLESSYNQCSSWEVSLCILLFWWCEDAAKISWGLWWGVYWWFDLESALDGTSNLVIKRKNWTDQLIRQAVERSPSLRGWGLSWCLITGPAAVPVARRQQRQCCPCASLSNIFYTIF
jgi:hypothetical protein